MKKIIFILGFFICIISSAQPTFVGFYDRPPDNTTNTTDPTVFTTITTVLSNAGTPAQSGDLIFIYAYKRTASGAITMNDNGGQSWTSGTTTASANATLSANYFWCKFNGTWSSDPSITMNATTNNNAILLIFRPVTSTNSWAVDAAQTGTFVDRAAAASFTITGWTPNHGTNVNIAVWNTDDDNTWGTLTGTGWGKGTLSAQFRNTSGSDVSSSIAFQLQNSAAATNNTSQTEATLGNDGGLTFSICFYEFTPAAHDVKQDFFKLFSSAKKPDTIYGTSFKIYTR